VAYCEHRHRRDIRDQKSPIGLVDGEAGGVVCGRWERDVEVGAGDGMEGCVVEVVGRECGVMGR
jgi:hypothetical protein